MVYIGASVAIAASRRLMAPNKRPPTAAETQTLDAIRADLKTPFDEATHGDLLKRLWKAGLDGPFEPTFTEVAAPRLSGRRPFD